MPRDPLTTRPAVFLDRDGTVIEEVDYLSRVEQVQLIPGAARSIARLNHAGVAVVVVTNQAGVARGYFLETRVLEVHAHLSALLAEFGATIDAFYYCPHHATAGVGEYMVDCRCRKPHPGMLQRAASDLGLDLTRSWMIGDKICDLRAGAAAGCQCVLVRTGHGKTVLLPNDTSPLNLAGDVRDLSEAVELWAAHQPTLCNG